MSRRIRKSHAIWTATAMLLLAGGLVQAETKPKYRGMLKNQKSNPWKIRREGDKTYIWAGGDKSVGKDAKWYDFTGAPMSPDELQFGIGKDRIRAIDDPYFVSPDDPRLLKVPPSPYRPTETPKTNNEIMVIGYVENNIARAYPTALLDHHELVNDTFKGKPVTVGW
jgi:Protein of unknown function (DUF3179)